MKKISVEGLWGPWRLTTICFFVVMRGTRCIMAAASYHGVNIICEYAALVRRSDPGVESEHPYISREWRFVTGRNKAFVVYDYVLDDEDSPCLGSPSFVDGRIHLHCSSSGMTIEEEVAEAHVFLRDIGGTVYFR